MPELFPSIPAFVLCTLIIAGAQLIYATVGFGAGMFAVALLALVLPDLRGAVATLLLLTLVTEIWVLVHAWRHARVKLLLGLLPTTAIGMWLGTQVLAGGEIEWLKRVLGLVVLGAGAWFLYEQLRAVPTNETAAPPQRRDHRGWWSLPVGLAAGTLAGLFGTGGPPVIIFLRSYRLDKGGFRATLLWYFFLMSGLRAFEYTRNGLLTALELHAALWLLPATIVGILAGMLIHHRVADHYFRLLVALLLMLLGLILALAGD